MVPARSDQTGVMTSYVHLIIGTSDNKMGDILRDFKSFNSRSLRAAMQEHSAESRRGWMLWLMERTGKKNSNNNDYQFRQQDNHPIELWDNYMMDQKLEYLHMNPAILDLLIARKLLQ